MASSLSSVVSNLVRASMGTSVPGTVTDNDLDRHVAELIVREAKKKAERYGQQGIRAYISNNVSDTNAPKTNKRFLTSIIKSTDDHNKTILRAQALAAQEVKREREEQERKQRRARAEEAAEAERQRRSGRGAKRKRNSDEEGWDRWDGRLAERKKVSRNWEVWDGHDEDEDGGQPRRRRRSRSRLRSRSRDRKQEGSSRETRVEEEEDVRRRRHQHGRSRSASPRRNGSRDGSRERNDDKARRHKRRRSRERSHQHSRRSYSRSQSPVHRSQSPSYPTGDSKLRKRKRSRSPKYALDDIRDEVLPTYGRSSSTVSESKQDAREVKYKLLSRDSHPQQPESPTSPSKVCSAGDSDRRASASSKRSPSPTPSRSPSPGPQLSVQLPSKMDRYFEKTYDPRLDVAPLTAPKVPATGLIDNAEFEGWDAMLELIRIRREDKEEKKRLERLGLLPPKEKSKSKKTGVIIDSGPAVADRWTGDAVNIMNIEYNKKGSVREWDMGKEGI